MSSTWPTSWAQRKPRQGSTLCSPHCRAPPWQTSASWTLLISCRCDGLARSGFLKLWAAWQDSPGGPSVEVGVAAIAWHRVEGVQWSMAWQSDVHWDQRCSRVPGCVIQQCGGGKSWPTPCQQVSRSMADILVSGAGDGMLCRCARSRWRCDHCIGREQGWHHADQVKGGAGSLHYGYGSLDADAPPIPSLRLSVSCSAGRVDGYELISSRQCVLQALQTPVCCTMALC